ncbi:MAG: OmpA family protein [Chitinivibrionales bacterium]|nr:OmpA family protein [Chitinivibrionales bacterium]MBD3394023.1 OmpA family protein [Chitinivibrionales bacterium]
MPEKKKKQEESKGAPAYMLTWGDMCTLLLCFFVMLLAMSHIDPYRFTVAASSFQNAFSGVLEELPQVLITRDILMPKMGGDEQDKKIAVEAAVELREQMKQEDKDEAVKVKVTDNGIAIKIADPVMFAVGKAALQPDFIAVLRDLRDIVLNRMPDAEIRVEGHTDDTPINTREYPSNWELSAARALSVVKFMKNDLGVDPARLSAVGYGEHRPLVPNTTPENRQKNRRIEIYVEYLEKKDTQ